ERGRTRGPSSRSDVRSGPAAGVGAACRPRFSGGQRQRLTLARALVLKPKLLILDEPLTGLDVSTRAQIANLLLDLQAAHGIAYLFISHDLPLLGHLADRIAVMSEGRLVEEGPATQIMSSPRHAETEKLLAAARMQQVPAGARQ
ncbi:MAG TPA: ABC transporter ATP-binding protein, partial [Terriglobales bacterium]|nr:ABC transporter ATP-binding protein [Terriglobales bacterium]